jgi:hypothetical protein
MRVSVLIVPGVVLPVAVFLVIVTASIRAILGTAVFVET